MKVCVINGNGGCGKDTFIKLCEDISKDLKIINCSTVDPIKNAAKELGWQGEKTEEARKFLSDLKDLSTKYNNLPFEYVKNTILLCKELYKNNFIIFIHCREPEEIQKFVDNFSATTVLIDASRRVKKILTNHADANVNDYCYNYIIDNNGDLKDLRDAAEVFLKSIE